MFVIVFIVLVIVLVVIRSGEFGVFVVCINLVCSVLYVVGNMFVDFCYWCGGNCIGGKFGD